MHSQETASPDIPKTTLERKPSLLTVDEVADFLRVNRKTVYEAVQAGAIPGVVRLGTVIRISREALKAWLSAGLPTQRGQP